MLKKDNRENNINKWIYIYIVWERERERERERVRKRKCVCVFGRERFRKIDRYKVRDIEIQRGKEKNRYKMV